MEPKNWLEIVSDEELDRQIDQARENWAVANESEPRAKSASYSSQKKMLVVKLTNGAEFYVPPSLVKELREASAKELKDVCISSNGGSIHWESLDVDFSIPGLIARTLGTKVLMSELGKQGGKKSSAAKSEAARKNGQKGGRPPKKVATVVSDKASPHTTVSSAVKGSRTSPTIG